MNWVDSLPKELQGKARDCNSPLCILFVDYHQSKSLNEQEIDLLFIPTEDYELCKCWHYRKVKEYLGLGNGMPKYIKLQKYMIEIMQMPDVNIEAIVSYEQLEYDESFRPKKLTIEDRMRYLKMFKNKFLEEVKDEI